MRWMLSFRVIALAGLALVVPIECLSFGPEASEFVGVSQHGRTLIKIPFKSEGESWNGGRYIYGAPGREPFRYCWINEALTDPKNVLSPVDHTHFLCASARGTAPTIFYKRAHFLAQEIDSKRVEDGFRLKEATAAFTSVTNAGYENSWGNVVEYYICEKGCNAAMPLFIFDVLIPEGDFPE